MTLLGVNGTIGYIALGTVLYLMAMTLTYQKQHYCKSYIHELYILLLFQRMLGGGRPSTCGDVYNFGVLLLEILTGKRPTDPIFENGLSIINLVERSFPV